MNGVGDRRDPAGGGIAVCVLGMHRSGTSALTRIINLLGVELSDDLVPARPDNPRGFWEQRKIVEIHDDLLESLHSSFDDFLPLNGDWLRQSATREALKQLVGLVARSFAAFPVWGFKDPRTCRLVPLWEQVFSESGFSGRYLIMLRDPRDIARSMSQRDGHSLNKSLAMTLSHLLDAERHTRGKQRAIVEFEDFLADWETVMHRAAGELGISWPRAYEDVAPVAAQFLDHSLRHHRSANSSEPALLAEGADAGLARWTSRAHEHFQSVSRGKTVDTALLDGIAAEFQANLPRLKAWRNSKSPYRTVMKLDAWARELENQRDQGDEQIRWLEGHSREVEKFCAQLKDGIEWLKQQKSAAEQVILERDAALAAQQSQNQELQRELERLRHHGEGKSSQPGAQPS